MFIVASSEKAGEILNIIDKWDLEYAMIGETTLNGRYSIINNDQMLYI